MFFWSVRRLEKTRVRSMSKTLTTMSFHRANISSKYRVPNVKVVLCDFSDVAANENEALADRRVAFEEGPVLVVDLLHEKMPRVPEGAHIDFIGLLNDKINIK